MMHLSLDDPENLEVCLGREGGGVEVGASPWRQGLGRRYGIWNSWRVYQEGDKVWTLKNKLKKKEKVFFFKSPFISLLCITVTYIKNKQNSFVEVQDRITLCTLGIIHKSSKALQTVNKGKKKKHKLSRKTYT